MIRQKVFGLICYKILPTKKLYQALNERERKLKKKRDRETKRKYVGVRRIDVKHEAN